MTDTADSLFWPKGRAAPKGPLVDPVAFALAFVGAPALVALIGAPLYVPLFAAGFGAPFWILLGGPLLWRAIRHGRARPGHCAWLGFKANLVATPILTVFGALLLGEPIGKATLGLILFFTGFGLIFAPLWGVIFGWLYGGHKPDLYHPNQGEIR